MKNFALPSLVLEDGLFPVPIRIEAAVRTGLPVFRVSGAGRRSLRDREDRIKTAILASGIQFPYSTVLVNLSPAGIPKDSSLLDLPIALCLLGALGIAPAPEWTDPQTLFLGELSLTGEVLSTAEAIPWALSAHQAGFRRVILPREAAAEMPVSMVEVFFADTLRECIEPHPRAAQSPKPVAFNRPGMRIPPGMSLQVTRALSLAAAGRHPILFMGPPGSGKSTAAELLHSFLPDPTEEEKSEMIRQRWVFQEASAQTDRPLRRPHHSITVTGLVGGGNPLRAGEASRASHGLLLLDELSEFDPAVIQALREPLERRAILHNRGGRTGILPACFWFAATSNPCPCGYYGSRGRRCGCGHHSRDRYRAILSGPIRDRIDLELFVDADPLPSEDLLTPDPLVLRERIEGCAKIQAERYGCRRFNGELNGEDTERFCEFDTIESERLWKELTRSIGSRRQEGGIRRLARTIADMDEASCIRAKDILEAVTFRFQHDFWDAPPPELSAFRRRGNDPFETADSSRKKV